MHVLFTGIGFPEIAITLLRIAMGVFFVFSGYHKLFNAARHQTIVNTMVADHVPLPFFNCWFVPMVEFLGGTALVLGLLTPLAALGLFCVCTVATLADGLKRVTGWKPIDRADYVDDVLYLPEVLYALILLAIIFLGAGPFSVDALILRTWGI